MHDKYKFLELFAVHKLNNPMKMEALFVSRYYSEGSLLMWVPLLLQ